MQETSDRVRKIVTEILGVEPERVVPGARLCPEDGVHAHVGLDRPTDDLGGDSLDVVELIMALEDEFRIDITDEESSKLNTGTVRDVEVLVESKIATPRAA